MVLGEDAGFPWLDGPAAEAESQAVVLLERLGRSSPGLLREPVSRP